MRKKLSIMINLLSLGSLLTTLIWYTFEDSYVEFHRPSPQRDAPKPSDLCKGCKEAIDKVKKLYNQTWKKHEENCHRFRLQTQHPQALFLISGDFNHISLSSTLPTFTQYVTCHTRDNKTLDLLYANTKEAYSSSPLPPLGGSDHNLVHLQPVYKPLVHREPVVKRTVRKWSAETEEALRDCFRSTVWDNLCSPLEDDLNSITDCITDYMNFCVDNTIPIKKVRCFSNNKPWINPEIKALLKEKIRVFRSGDKQELRVVQKKLKWKIRQGKENYRRKMEEQLQQDNIRGVWNSLKTISGQKPTPQAAGDLGWVNDLNKYFNRFDQPPTPPTASSPLLQPPSSSGTACPSSQDFTPLSFTPPSSQSLHPPPASVDSNIHPPPPKSTLSISALQVRNKLRKIKPQLLRDKLELSGVDHHIE
ncbi:unnamed protein product [Oreochromis niloticus]|nr:unnamed protein product [Mustela putorius furo]